MPKIKKTLWVGGALGLAAMCLNPGLWAQTKTTPDQGTATPGPNAPKYPDYPSETPAKFVPPTYGADFASRDVMIPMRDGVKLHTVILLPKGAKQAGILLTRTP